MIRVGLTGGIGSGKSTVCQLFAELGVPVYNSDLQARAIMSGEGTVFVDGDEVRDAVLRLFGTSDRSEIARKAFSDNALLASLNAIVHPAVRRDFNAWVAEVAEVTASGDANGGAKKYVILESAILFESGFNKLVDNIIAVSAPLETRIQRVMERDGLDRRQILGRVARQMTDDERAAGADYVIDNSLSVSELRVRVKEIDKLLKQ